MQSTTRAMAVTYLCVESIALFVYWTVLTVNPRWREPFLPPGGDSRALFAFALGDLLLYGATGVAAVVGIIRVRPWRSAALWLHAGAAMYAAIYAIALWRLAPDRWLGAAMMAPALIGPVWIARRFGRAA